MKTKKAQSFTPAKTLWDLQRQADSMLIPLGLRPVVVIGSARTADHVTVGIMNNGFGGCGVNYIMHGQEEYSTYEGAIRSTSMALHRWASSAANWRPPSTT